MKKIGEILVENRIITNEQLNDALKKQKAGTDHKRIGEMLIEMGYLTYDSLLQYLERQLEK